jgi:pimeloyl-ACP methyl ester carboxylesterase
MTITRTPAKGMIDVGTTKLYHEVQGAGPPLLLITTGGGDAGFWEHIAPVLAAEFTVVTYDPRGRSRSPRPHGWTSTSVEEQADDAAALLRKLGCAPAVVVGHSGGAAVTCALAASAPDVVRHAIMYEPPLLAILPTGAEMVAEFQATIERAMAEGGPRHAMEVFIRANAGDDGYAAWKRATDPELQERMFGNAATFFEIELPAFATFVPDREKLKASGVPLTVIVGQDNLTRWYGDAGRWLVDAAGASLVTLPGGHAGFETHRDDFIELVRRIGRGATHEAPN